MATGPRLREELRPRARSGPAVISTRPSNGALGIADTTLVARFLTEPTTLLVGTAVGLLAGLYPALRAARIEPLEALRQ